MGPTLNSAKTDESFSFEDKLTPYQVDPALEYRTLAHASDPPINYQRPSIRHDGRLLAVGTDRGVVIWDLARGTELRFLTIGLAWHTTFEPSGDLLTSGDLGVWRWPVRVGTDRGEFQIGPPRQLPSAGGTLCDLTRTGWARSWLWRTLHQTPTS